MPRSYRHIQQYEKEMVELKEQGMTVREIGAKFGFTKEQTHDFFKRRNRKQRKKEAGIVLKRKGRPPKNYVVSKEDKVAECQDVATLMITLWPKISFLYSKQSVSIG